jgi:hypothetical protein
VVKDAGLHLTGETIVCFTSSDSIAKYQRKDSTVGKKRKKTTNRGGARPNAGRKKGIRGTLKHMSVTIRQDFLEKLDAYRAERHLNRSQVVETAIGLLLESSSGLDLKTDDTFNQLSS